MAEGKGKYGNLLSEIRDEQQVKPASTILIPVKPPRLAGKRSDPAFLQKGIFLKKETIRLASDRLVLRPDKMDFSDLMQALLEAWLDTPE